MMLPRLSDPHHPDKKTQSYIKQLLSGPFKGSASMRYSDRLVVATDNSIYQVCPDAVLYPACHEDLIVALHVANQPEFQSLTFSARGGGTGTNGQSLCSGILIDFTRNMNKILEIDFERGTAVVEPGVVLDELNRALGEEGYFFPPHASSGSRATLGGMINTDACGKGSLIYGRTSQHIQALRCVLLDGSALLLEDGARIENRVAQSVETVLNSHRHEIEQTWPQLIRYVTGYNLAHAIAQTPAALIPLIAGSEGTLAFVTEATVRIKKVPQYKTLVVLGYPDFDSILEDAPDMMASQPSDIEAMDDMVIQFGGADSLLSAHQLGPGQTKALCLVEYRANSKQEISLSLKCLTAKLKANPNRYRFITSDAKEIASYWRVRKSGVGVILKLGGRRKPISFMEDTVVPTVHLRSYIQEVRKLLDSHGLRYAMYGHIDVGCLHIRPAMDMRDPNDVAQMKQISDRVAELVLRYNGQFSGEHGKGFRSQYTALFLLPNLLELMRKVKRVFDPKNRLNPGKVASPFGSEDELVSLEGPLRGAFDAKISKQDQLAFGQAIDCNGNGMCLNRNRSEVMCPSFKVGLDLRHSPKGRAIILREWLRQKNSIEELGQRIVLGWNWLQKTVNTIAKKRGQYDFSNEVFDALSGCLSCKACVTNCPIAIDIPDYKSQFLEQYYSRYLRSIRDCLLGYMEYGLPIIGVVPKKIQKKLSTMIGIVDSPIAKRPSRQVRRLEKQHYTRRHAGHVILIQDALTRYYYPDVVSDFLRVCEAFKKRVIIAPFFPSGKPLHVKGFREAFKAQVRRNQFQFQELIKQNLPMVCIEPSIALLFREEYRQLGQEVIPNVLLIQEWLAMLVKRQGGEYKDRQKSGASERVALFSHCSVRTAAGYTSEDWRSVFRVVGVAVESPDLGCCGMAGAYGHEAENVQMSQDIFNQNCLASLQSYTTVLAEGMSCRAQIERFGTSASVYHPLSYLALKSGGELL